MTQRRELTDAQYERIQPHLPPVKPRTGRPNRDHRLIINAILWILRTGAPWRDLPERYGPWSSAYSRFYRWRESGVWDHVALALQNEGEGRRQIDWSIHFVDGTSVRAHHDAAGARLYGRTTEQRDTEEGFGRSRGGWGSKIHLRTDGNGLPMKYVLTPGQCHDVTACLELMEQAPLSGGRPGRARSKPARIGGDKGYSAGWIRSWLRKRAIGVVIPRKSNERRRGFFNKDLYRRRHKVECTFGRLKRKFRRLATRYEKLGSHFLAMWTIGSIALWSAS